MNTIAIGVNVHEKGFTYSLLNCTYLSENHLAKIWSGRYTATSLKMFQNLDSEPIASRAPGSDSSIHIKDSFLSPLIALQQLSKLSWACRRSHVQCVLIFKICSGKSHKKFWGVLLSFESMPKYYIWRWSSKVWKYLWVQINFQNIISFWELFALFVLQFHLYSRQVTDILILAITQAHVRNSRWVEYRDMRHFYSNAWYKRCFFTPIKGTP